MNVSCETIRMFGARRMAPSKQTLCFEMLRKELETKGLVSGRNDLRNSLAQNARLALAKRRRSRFCGWDLRRPGLSDSYF